MWRARTIKKKNPASRSLTTFLTLAYPSYLSTYLCPKLNSIPDTRNVSTPAYRGVYGLTVYLTAATCARWAAEFERSKKQKGESIRKDGRSLTSPLSLLEEGGTSGSSQESELREHDDNEERMLDGELQGDWSKHQSPVMNRRTVLVKLLAITSFVASQYGAISPPYP